MFVKPQFSIPSNKSEELTYMVHSWSGFSNNFHPKNIMCDDPTDQSSRWSTGSNRQTQYLVLELERLSIVQSILFGKYQKIHVCNLKEFKIYGGASLTDMTEILDNGLRNDNIPERFQLKHSHNGLYFACKYIKIVPIMAWGPNFNFSIWYVQLQGISDASIVLKVQQDFNQYREKEAIRLCLKLFRQRNYNDVFKALENKSNIQLEHPLLTQLYKQLVENGDFKKVEALVCEADEQGFFQEYLVQQPYTPLWKKINATDNYGRMPSPRGGHHMCVNDEDGIVYLYGGWNGVKDLSDFWELDLNRRAWRLISEDTSNEGGPRARSCFKSCYDPIYRKIYLFGKYMDSSTARNNNLDADFYSYEIDTNIWTEISSNTKNENGPSLIYDHQMCIDVVSQKLYISGGKIVSPETTPISYSGLYCYDISKNEWTKLNPANNMLPDGTVEGRVCHSMVFDPVNFQLLLLCGERHKKILSDLYIYDIETNIFNEVFSDCTPFNGPHPGFSQPTVLDVERRELFMMSGLTKLKDSSHSTVQNLLWVYNLSLGTWSEVYNNKNSEVDYWSRMQDLEPQPRFAFPLIHYAKTDTHYLFGGNPDTTSTEALRLNDLWELKFTKHTSADILRHIKLLIRQHRFMERCQNPKDRLTALHYLRTEVHELVHLNDPSEREQFQKLANHLFSGYFDITSPSVHTDVPYFKNRTELYEQILEYFPNGMKQPIGNLTELIKLS